MIFSSSSSSAYLVNCIIHLLPTTIRFDTYRVWTGLVTSTPGAGLLMMTMMMDDDDYILPAADALAVSLLRLPVCLSLCCAPSCLPACLPALRLHYLPVPRVFLPSLRLFSPPPPSQLLFCYRLLLLLLPLATRLLSHLPTHPSILCACYSSTASTFEHRFYTSAQYRTVAPSS